MGAALGRGSHAPPPQFARGPPPPPHAPTRGGGGGLCNAGGHRTQWGKALPNPRIRVQGPWALRSLGPPLLFMRCRGLSCRSPARGTAHLMPPRPQGPFSQLSSTFWGWGGGLPEYLGQSSTVFSAFGASNNSAPPGAPPPPYISVFSCI